MEPGSCLPSQNTLVRDLLSHFRCTGSTTLTETTKSWVFVAKDTVFKLKKQVRDELQDLTPLRARHDNTLTEIDLNRRLAPDMYLGAVRVGRMDDGRLVLDNRAAETVDWLVRMRRLPADRMLDALIGAGTPKAELSRALGPLVPMLANFYRTASATRLGAADLMTVQEDQLAMARDVLLHPQFRDLRPRVKRVLGKLEASWPELAQMLSERVQQEAIVECHGDMRPEHICLTDPPVIYDCLEFNRTLRLSDPYSELVFLGMECGVLGAPWIGRELIAGLEAHLGTAPRPALLRIYEALHAVVRARLCLAHLLQPIPRTPRKWMPLGLQYLDVAERSL